MANGPTTQPHTLMLSEVRRAVKCDEIWPRDPWSISVGVPHTCIWNERNVGGSDGDCLKFSLSVEAVVPEVEDTANRWSPA